MAWEVTDPLTGENTQQGNIHASRKGKIQELKEEEELAKNLLFLLWSFTVQMTLFGFFQRQALYSCSYFGIIVKYYFFAL